MMRTMRRTGRFLGGAAVTTAATALLLSTSSGTANAAADTIVVQQFNASFTPVCTQNYVAGSAAQTIHDPTCPGAVYASINSTAIPQSITVRSEYVAVKFYGLYIIPIGPYGLDINVPGKMQ